MKLLLRFLAPKPAAGPRSRRSGWLPGLLVVTLMALTGQGVRATTYLELTPEQMLFKADMIFVGTVEAVRPGEGADHPFTAVTFDVERWLVSEGRPVDQEESGARLPDSATLEFMGGVSASGERLTVGGVPQFQARQRVLVFAYDDEGLASPVVGVNQGVWTLSAGGARGQSGSFLEVPAPGRLAEGASGAGLDELVEAMIELLESGPPADAPAAEPAPDTDAELDAEPGGEAEPEAEAAEDPEPEPEPEPDSEAESEAGSGRATPSGLGGEDGVAGEAPQADGAADPPSPGAVVSYRVDDSGGPLLLADAVARAAEAWEAAAPGGASFEAVSAEDGSGEGVVNLIKYGDAGLFGPDALSLTLVRAGTQATEVLVNPRAGARLPAVLLHELGVILGLPEGGAGVGPADATDAPLAPTPEAVAALRELRTFRVEDINRDGVVDFYDLVALGAAFGDRGVNLAADLNGDGVVDSADLELLEAAYEFLPPAESAPD